MRIESIKAEPDRAGRFRVILETGERMWFYRQTVEDFALCPGRELTDEQWQRLLDSASALSAKMRAVRIVAASSVSKNDLQHRLVQKGEEPAKAAEAVAWMEERNLVDDGETARQIISRCIAKGYGLQRAKQALYEKRIPKEFWDAALADYPEQNEYIVRFLRGRITDPADQKQVKKAVDALLRRGHSYAHIRSALRHLEMDEEDFPEE